MKIIALKEPILSEIKKKLKGGHKKNKFYIKIL
jgi:hypothetical protein